MFCDTSSRRTKYYYPKSSNFEIPFQAQYIYLILLSYETDLQRELMLWIYRFSFATEGDDIADIRMQNKQMTICENISGLFYHSV